MGLGAGDPEPRRPSSSRSWSYEKPLPVDNPSVWCASGELWGGLPFTGLADRIAAPSELAEGGARPIKDSLNDHAVAGGGGDCCCACRAALPKPESGGGDAALVDVAEYPVQSRLWRIEGE